MSDFSDEQKKYLEGFLSGTSLARQALGLEAHPQLAGAGGAASNDPHEIARQKTTAQGKTLTPEDQAKSKKDPFAMWDELSSWSAQGVFPKGTDVFLTKFHGLFYVAPAQNSYMARLRIPGGQLNSFQLRGLADLSDRCAEGGADVTTRANFQIRQIPAENAVDFLMGLSDLGLTSRGSGADNIRNVTGSPTAGLDAQELLDTQPFCRELHHYILNHKELYGLPRKFNIAYDGAGVVASLDDTNDVGFSAVRVGEGKAVPAGVYFRLRLGGITGHKDFAIDEGVLVEPAKHLEVSRAILMVFLEKGDRTDRKKARMKYVLDDIGHDGYLAAVEEKLGWKLTRLPLDDCEPRPSFQRWGHVGFHRQKQPGLVWAGVVVPVGKLTSAQMRGLADLADKYGNGQIRLTVWQNLLIPNVPERKTQELEKDLQAIGLTARTGSVMKSLVACTGSRGCKYANADTKGHALAIGKHLDENLGVDVPVNIHLTGCPNSCAQHYIGDIGLLGARIDLNEDEQTDGFHVLLGGGYGTEKALARPFRENVLAEDCPKLIEGLLRSYLKGRSNEDETFQAYIARTPNEILEESLS